MENMNKNIAYEHIDFSEITKVRFCTLVEKCNYIPNHWHQSIEFSNVLMRADIAYNSSSTSRAQTNDLDEFKKLYAIIGVTVLNSISTCYINTIAVSESSNQIRNSLKV